MQVEIKSETYEYKPKQQKQMPKSIMMAFMMSGITQYASPYGEIKRIVDNTLEPGPRLVEEYKLILDKKSKLSRS